MRLAYVDTSFLVAIAFGEPRHRALAEKLEEFDRLIASNLTEAELRSVFRREEVENPESVLARMTWVFPSRALSDEYREALNAGYLRGADLRHLACAMFLRETLGELAFLTADRRQQEVARQVGF